ncbi:hypothetical protein CYMTET_27386 [Cymbomonas tetramitiformis]|uniref:Uncharacterized protein n=1 Tax=Cymbomonas tetramitiformis TaxID=36881 RepID=A0AAE0KWZ0_9CHLO|nr:hypothetical protein CYMTET_27386 [Cymbomonas tetramitiformis]
MDGHLLVVGGDFNAVAGPSLDSVNTSAVRRENSLLVRMLYQTGSVLPMMCIGVAWTKAIAYIINGGKYLLNFRRNGKRERPQRRFLEERDVALAFDQLARQENEELGEGETKWN